MLPHAVAAALPREAYAAAAAREETRKRHRKGKPSPVPRNAGRNHAVQEELQEGAREEEGAPGS